MIIESGVDVLQALCGNGSRAPGEGLWVVGMDENLRLRIVECVTESFDGSVEHHLDDIADVLDHPWNPPRYIVLAWSTGVPHGRDDHWLHELELGLRKHDDLPPVELLGLVVFDPAGIFATLPQCEFSLYPELAHLPRAHLVYGPHDAACGCVVCAAERRAFEEQERPDELCGFETSGETRGGGEPAASTDGLYFDPWSRRWYPEPARAYRRWTRDEEATLIRSHDEGLTSFDLSMLLQRQPGAIRARLNKLGRSARPVIPTVPPAR